MNYGDLTKAEIALKAVWKYELTNSTAVVDYVLKGLGLEGTQAEMMNKGILIYRKSHEDYFIPWYNNKFGPNSVKSVKDELLDKAFSEYDSEFASLARKKKLFQDQLNKVNEALEEKRCTIPMTDIFRKYNIDKNRTESETTALLDKYFGRDKECLDTVKANDENNLSFNRFISKKSIKEQIDSLKVAGEETPCEDSDIPNTPGEWCQDCTKAECKYNRLNPANNKPKSFTDLSAEELTKLALSK